MNLTPDQFQAFMRICIFLLEILMAGVLIYWMRSHQRGYKEPWSFLVRLIVWGAITALFAALLELRYSINIEDLKATQPDLVMRYGAWYEVLNSGIAGLVEELAKYAVGVMVVLYSRHFHKLTDAILYMILIGLGFSLMEDIFYLLDPHIIAPYRLISFYVHAGTSSIIGYAMGRYKFGLGSYKQLSLAIWGAVLLHFGYNLATSLSDTTLSFWFTLLITLYISMQAIILFRKALVEEYCLEKSGQSAVFCRLLNLKKAAPSQEGTAQT